MTRTALIVGAGIGGLSAGIALRQAGWDVRVFERASTPRELGFGVALAPNAVAALAALGVADTVLARAYAPDWMRGEARRPDGTLLKRTDLPIRAALGGPLAIALRSALHGALLDALGGSSETLMLSSEAAGFHADGRSVTLRLTDGRTAEGDVLIGADGIGSVIRRVLHPSEPPPRASGLVGVRGAVDGALHYLGDKSAVYYLGRGIEAMVARASKTGIYWFLSLARELIPGNTRDGAAIVAHMAAQFDETFRSVASMTEDLRVDDLVDRDPLPFWSQGRVTLMGDAAHPLLPHTGQGAAQAIVDGVALGKALGGTGDAAEALRAYEAERKPKTSVLLGQGRRTARVMRSTSPLICALRDAAVRVAPVTTFVKIIARINRRAGTDVRR